MLRYLFMTLVLYLATHSAYAGEVFGLGGALTARPSNERTYIWALDYRHRLSEHFDISAAWINEGHVTNHHRDGATAQIWARTTLLDPSFSISAGIGPYAYFDTTNLSGGAPEIDAHGWGVVYSLAATWRVQGRWLLQLRANRIETRRSIDTTSLLLGVGYQLDDLPASEGRPAILSGIGESSRSEIGIMLGTTIVNSFESETSFAKSIEYRRGLGRYLDWTIAWLNEGSSRLVRRNGVVTQLWAVRPVLDERATLEAGVGPYVVVDTYGGRGVERLAGIFSLGASYRLTPRWRARVSWSRVFADHPYDSDVLLVGAAYTF